MVLGFVVDGVPDGRDDVVDDGLADLGAGELDEEGSVLDDGEVDGILGVEAVLHVGDRKLHDVVHEVLDVSLGVVRAHEGVTNGG